MNFLIVWNDVSELEFQTRLTAADRVDREHVGRVCLSARQLCLQQVSYRQGADCDMSSS